MGQSVVSEARYDPLGFSCRRFFNQYSPDKLVPLAVARGHDQQFVGGHQLASSSHGAFTGLVSVGAANDGIVAWGNRQSL